MSSAYSTFVGPPEVGEIHLPVAPLSTEQYLRMIEAGVFGSSDKVELIGGFITPMAPVGPEHNGSLLKLTKRFAAVADRFEIAVQATVSISAGEVLEPDFALLTERADGYMSALPRAADIRLLVESAASSLKHDRQVKLSIYASAGIPEYWIIDLKAKSLEVYRDPVGDSYQSIQIFSGDDAVSPLACPEVSLRVGSLFA